MGSLAAEAVGAVVDIGADPIHAVAAQLAVAAPLVGTFQASLAAVLADQGTVGALSTVIAVAAGTFFTEAAIRAYVVGTVFAGQTARAEINALLADLHALGTENGAGRAGPAFHTPRISSTFVAQPAVRADVLRTAFTKPALVIGTERRAHIAGGVAAGADGLRTEKAKTAALATHIRGAFVADLTVSAEPLHAVLAAAAALIVRSAEGRTFRTGFSAIGADPVVTVHATATALAVHIGTLVTAAAVRADVFRALRAAMLAFKDGLSAAVTEMAILAKVVALRAGAAVRAAQVGAFRTHAAIRASDIPAVTAVFSAVRANIRAVFTALAADTGDHTTPADAAVVASAVVFHAVLAVAAVSTEIAIAVLAVLSAAWAHLAALFAGLPADTDNGAGVTPSAALTIRFRAICAAFSAGGAGTGAAQLLVIIEIRVTFAADLSAVRAEHHAV